MIRQYQWTKTNQESGTDSKRSAVRLLPSQENHQTWLQIEQLIHIEISNNIIQANLIHLIAIEHLFKIIRDLGLLKGTSMKISRTTRTTLQRTLTFQTQRWPHLSKVTIRQNITSLVYSSLNISHSNRRPHSTTIATLYIPSSRLLQTTLQETQLHLFNKQRQELSLTTSIAWLIRPLSCELMLDMVVKIWILRTSIVRSSCEPSETTKYSEK